MNIKMIAMDMDGTLLRSDDTISDKTKEILIDLQAQGTKLVLASGRSHRRMLQYAKELRMNEYGGWLIEVNGIALYNTATDERDVSGRMKMEDARKLFRYFQQFPVEISAYLDAEMYDYIPEWMMEEKRAYKKAMNLPEDHPLTGGAFLFIYDARNGYPDIHMIQDAEGLDQDVNKICVSYQPEVIAQVSEQARKDLGNDYWLGLTSPKWLEILNKGVNKGTALTRLMEKLQIDKSSCIAFGDGENDLDMLEAAGMGIAMGNALDGVKAKADFVTASNNEDGIYEALRCIIDENPHTI